VHPALMAVRTGEEALQEELLKLAVINLDEENETPSAALNATLVAEGKQDGIDPDWGLGDFVPHAHHHGN